MRKTDRIGETFTTNEGYVVTIINYKNNKEVIVRFNYGEEVTTTYQKIVMGSVKNPYNRTICNIGFIGSGLAKTSGCDKDVCIYKKWVNMIKRCYDSYDNNGWTVCSRWHCYQDFYSWCDSHWYELTDGDNLCLTKGLLGYRNREYCPDNCVLLPYRVHKLLIRRGMTEDKRLSIIRSELFDQFCTGNIPEFAYDNLMRYVETNV